VLKAAESIKDRTNNHDKTAFAIDLDKVAYRYDSSANVTDLSISQWHVEYGSQIFLYGDSGSGKTTLLNLLAGVIKPSKGSIQLLGSPFSSMKARQRDKFRARHIGVVFQQFNLIPYLSVIKNIQLASYFASTTQESIQESAEELLLKLKLPVNTLHKRSSELSVGQQQRVAIARALINQPEVLLVDEPTSALDSSARDAFMQVLLDACQAANATMIFVSHDMSLQDYFESSIAMPLLCQPENHPEEIQ
jgi:putative ABC transport system ATP-binding protein